MIEFKEFEESWGARSGFDITPMLDMIFILLIFFLLTAGAARPAVSVDLPDSDTAEIPDRQTAVISVNASQELFFNGESVTEQQLGMRLEALYRGENKNPVYIESDESVDFGIVVRLMDICKKSGAPEISFLVEQAGSSD